MRMLKIIFILIFLCSTSFAQVFLDRLDVDNIRLDGNTISTTNTNGDLTVDLNGAGRVVFTDLTATTVPYLDSSKKLQSSSVTPTELGYVSGVTSSLCGINQSCTVTNKTISGSSNTFSNIPNSATTATSANTVSAIVARDSSGNFSFGTGTGNITGSVTGNASTATALAANGANCSAGQFPLGVDASGAVESCTALPTSISGTANQITASASTGAITLSIPSSPTLPGTTTGTFSGNITGNVTGTADNATNTAITNDTTTNATMYPTWVTTTTGNLPQKVSSTKMTFNPSTGMLTTTGITAALTGNASTATALAANGTNCSAGQYPLGVDASGNAESCGAITVLGTITTGVWHGTAVGALYGGTGGDSSGSTGLAKVSSGTWSYATLVDADVSSSAAIARSKVATGTANYVVINAADGTLASEQKLANSRGGTGQDSSASTGLAKVSSGTWSFATLVDADVSSSAAIARNKIANGTANYVVINDGSGTLTSEATLAVSRGGTNLASGTSGGVLAYTASGTLASSGALAQYGVVVGGGAGAVPSTVTPDASTVKWFKSGGSSANPAWTLHTAPTVQVFITGTAQTYTIPAGCVGLRVTVTGGGGGGGGAATGAGAAGAGGGAGGTARKWLAVTAGNTLTYSVGAAGTAGANTGGNGGNGGDSTVSSGTQTISTITGSGGVGGTGTTGTGAQQGGIGGAASGGDINSIGGDGTGSLPISSSLPVGGNGGASFWGGGGFGRAAGGGAGNDGKAYGSGGGGGSTNGGNQAGGAGKIGAIVFEEFY